MLPVELRVGQSIRLWDSNAQDMAELGLLMRIWLLSWSSATLRIDFLQIVRTTGILELWRLGVGRVRIVGLAGDVDLVEIVLSLGLLVVVSGGDV